MLSLLGGKLLKKTDAGTRRWLKEVEGVACPENWRYASYFFLLPLT